MTESENLTWITLFIGMGIIGIAWLIKKLYISKRKRDQAFIESPELKKMKYEEMSEKSKLKQEMNSINKGSQKIERKEEELERLKDELKKKFIRTLFNKKIIIYLFSIAFTFGIGFLGCLMSLLEQEPNDFLYWVSLVFGIGAGISITFFIIECLFVYYQRQKQKKKVMEIKTKIWEMKTKIDEKELKAKQEERYKLINEGDRSLAIKNYPIAHQKFVRALQIANELNNIEIQKKIQDKIIQVVKGQNSYIIPQIKIIEKEADYLTNKNKFNDAILEHLKALEKTNEMFTSNEKNRELEKIKAKINEIYILQIKELLETGDELRKELKFDNSLWSFKDALEIANKMYNSMEKEQAQSDIKTYFDSLYSDMIKEKIKTGNQLKKDMKYDDSIKIFRESIKIAEKMYNSRIKNEGINKLKSLIHQAQIAKIKNIILNLGVKFDRLHISEIAEKCKESEDQIENTALDMINKKEIYAEYFKSTKSVVFDKQANIEEIDRLMSTYREWEENGVEKK